MSFISDPTVTIQFDASCSTDPDLSPQSFGPAAQGLFTVVAFQFIMTWSHMMIIIIMIYRWSNIII